MKKVLTLMLKALQRDLFKPDLRVTLSLFLIFSGLNCKEGSGSEETVKEGNLVLSSSQQPSPLFGFGQNIMNKGILQFYAYGDNIRFNNKNYADFMPGFLYAIRDDFSVFVNLPINISPKSPGTPSSVSFSASVQFEYAYYSKTKSCYEKQATIVAALSGPNGSFLKQPTVDRKSETFFIGGTYSYTEIDWYAYGSLGASLPFGGSSTGNITGKSIYYQGGLGRNICHAQDRIYLLLVEAFGINLKPNYSAGVINPDSGGNLIFIAPSIWISGEKLILQAGVAIPVLQKLSGDQAKYKYQLGFNMAWTF